MQSLEVLLAQASDLVWGPPLLILLFGTHLFLTFRLKFIQRFIPLAIRLSVAKDKDGDGDVSQFGALTTALAATIGTGNIVGVATAVAAGGPGAVLWMWLTGVFGISTKYAEAVLAVKYRVKAADGTMAGGPMYALERGLGSKALGKTFALLTAVAAFGIGCMTQANSISSMANATFGVPTWLTGVVMATLTTVVVLGGIKSIAGVCERLVPAMAVFYVLGCLVLIVMHIDRVPGTIALIVNSAFSGHAALGGFMGAGVREAMRFGIARGLFSNESGLGSAPIVAAAAQTRNPVRQALVSSTGTFWDTVVVCALTGIVVVNSGGWSEGLVGAEITQRAFSDLPVVGNWVLTIGMFTFGFSTILGWAYYGEVAAEYLFGRPINTLYRVVWIAAVFVGSVSTLQAVWSFSDVANGLMAVPNLISLLALSGIIVKETQEYLWSGNIDKKSPGI
ncbi:MAG: sodium:alanine symporter family protein [Acidobacteria bacterium]|nr:sodium:alanine symporter family protein [Acidobacteriota bacterium]